MQTYTDLMCEAKTDFEQIMVLQKYDLQCGTPRPPEFAQERLNKSAVWIKKCRQILKRPYLLEIMHQNGLKWYEAYWMLSAGEKDDNS